MNKKLGLIILVTITTISFAYSLSSADNSHYSTKVTIDKGANGFVYIIDDKKKTETLLLNLACRNKKTHTDVPTKSLLFVHEEVNISKINNTIGIMLKARCGKPDVYYFNKSKTRLVEISFSQAKQY